MVRFFFFQAEDGIRDWSVTGVQTCALPILGGSGAAPTISVADGGITSAKLAPNAIGAANIADGSLPPAKISGTAAVLGSNTFKIGRASCRERGTTTEETGSVRKKITAIAKR